MTTEQRLVVLERGSFDEPAEVAATNDRFVEAVRIQFAHGNEAVFEFASTNVR